MTKFDTSPSTGLVPGVLRHDVVAPYSPAHTPHADRSPEWLAAYNAAYSAALRGEKADRATPGPQSREPFSIAEIADGLFAKSWKKLATSEDNQ